MNINITDDLLKECVEAGIKAFQGIDEMATMGDAKRAEARAVIEAWEASRTPGQLERTNHALALELADVKSRLYEAMEAKEVAINREAEQMNRAENLKSETIQLKSDVAELNERLHERTQLLLTKWPRGVLPPWPVVKVEPEIEWHNPDNLTPEQVGTGEGWRLCLASERETNLPHDSEMWEVNGNWIISVCRGKEGSSAVTYRTKAPLPR